MDQHKRPKLIFPVVWYQNFLHPGRLNSRPPTRIEVIKVIKVLKNDIKIHNSQWYETGEYGRYDPDLNYMKKQLWLYQNYLDLLSCC